MPSDYSPWTPIITQIFIGLTTLVCSAIAAWKSNSAKKSADGAAKNADIAAAKADVAATKAGDAAVANDTHHQLVTQSLGTLTTGTEAIRTQSNGNTDKLLDTIRHLTNDLNTSRIESAIAAATAAAELSALKEATAKEIAALTTEVNGLRTQRTGGRATDLLSLPPNVALVPPIAGPQK